MNFESKFTLSKRHFSECFEQSSSLQPKTNKRYFKALALFALGLFFYWSQIEGLSAHLGMFFFILAFVDVLSVKFAKGWWVTRQMFSKAAGNDVTITLNDEGINIESDFAKQLLTWSQIQAYQETEKGIVLTAAQGGNSYISKSCFSDDAWLFLLEKLSAK
ncbi:YcxB family protein [Thalassotalea psychrophila]|uniref:YcxB family protein n=1 Tax=Thalassotalea psychrophila TaxID=3065647 RepID=A0ABY9TTK6_9GAMM|nr:YcxB family protein [Colwelliaceae bacterium SQ149]